MALYTVATGATVLAQDVNQYFQLLTGQITDQPVTVNNRIQAALSGATVQSAYVGGTASGPPLSGTFRAGDFAIAQTGSAYICTSTGSPGQWRPVAMPTTTGGPPKTGSWTQGDVVMDVTTFGFWICSVGGSPGTWVAQGGALTSGPPCSVTVMGTGGGTTYGYEVVASNDEGDAIRPVPTYITNGNATLNTTNYNRITWTQPFGCAPKQYKILRVGGGPNQGLVGTVSGTTFSFGDTGISAGGYSYSSVNRGGLYARGGNLALFRVYLGNSSFDWTTTGPSNWNAIPMDTVLFDPQGIFNAAGGYSWSAPVTGYYQTQISALIAAPFSSGAVWPLRLATYYWSFGGYVNNGIWPLSVVDFISAGSAYVTMAISAPVYIPAGVPTSMAISGDTAGQPIRVYNDPSNTIFSMQYIGS